MCICTYLCVLCVQVHVFYIEHIYSNKFSFSLAVHDVLFVHVYGHTILYYCYIFMVWLVLLCSGERLKHI